MKMGGIFLILPTSVVASSPLYIPALWHLSHLTTQRCGIFPILPHSVVANSTVGFNVPSGLIRPVHLSNCGRGLGCRAAS